MSRRRRLRRSTSKGPRLIYIALEIIAVTAVIFVVLVALGSAAAYGQVQEYLKGLPDYHNPKAFRVAEATRIYSADGKLIGKFYLENRTVVPLSKISTDLANGIVAIEDERFYEHHGVDPEGLARAMVKNLQSGWGAEGASTITQQYVRNTILLNERTDVTLARKIREAYLAIQLEKVYSKQDILNMYLNTIFFGENAYGAEAAAQTYFAKRASALTLPEAATLAGLPQSPSRLDPYLNPEGATVRRNEVLGAMLRNGYITQEQYDAAVKTRLKVKRAKTPMEGIYGAPYFVSHVRRLLQEQYDPSVVFKGGLTVYTTIDMRMQAMAEKATHRLSGKRAPEAALVSIDPRNGHIKALVGGRSYAEDKFSLATQAKRQPGSSFKTFVLTDAIEQGMPPYYRIASSSPAIIPTKPKPWVVNNSEGSGYGMMSLEAATWSSVNTVFARLAFGIKPKTVASVAKRMGITTYLPPLPSIALGAAGVTPLDMASAYGTLATGGVYNKPVAITKVVDSDGKVIFVAKKKPKKVLKPAIAAAVTDILKGVVRQGTGRRANINRPQAGKTGTSEHNRDVWFVGYTPQLSTAVWVGHRREKTIYVNGSRAFGGTVAAPIWAEFMRAALAGKPKLDFPDAPKPTYSASKFKIPGGTGGAPRVAGGTLTSALAKLKGSGYQIVIRYVNSSKPAGTVISTTVSGRTVTLIVSSGPAAPPRPGGGGGTGGGTGGGGGGGNTTGTTPPPSQ